MNLLQDLIPTLWDRNFQPLAGGRVEVYTDKSISVLAKLHSTADGGDSELPNPLPLNSAGRFSDANGADSTVYFKENSVYVIIYDRNGVKAKEFLFPDSGLGNGALGGVSSAEDLAGIDGEDGMYVLVKNPAPFRWYKWVEENSNDDGIFNIAAKDGHGSWMLVLQDNWVYSSWFGAATLNEIHDALIPSHSDLDLCFNSEASGGAGGDFHFPGRIKLVDGADIKPDGQSTIWCEGGFEAKEQTFANYLTRFYVYGGSHAASNIKNLRVAGFMNHLFLNDDLKIEDGDTLEVYTLDGVAGKNIDIYGVMHVTETTNIDTGYQIKTNHDGIFFLNGSSISASYLKNMADWSGVRSSKITGGGLEFQEKDTYNWQTAPNETLEVLSGHMNFNSEVFPKFARATRGAKITNSGDAYYPIPKGIRLADLKGNFDPSGGEFFNETIPANCSLNPNMSNCTFVNCVFETGFSLNTPKRTLFKNCVFNFDILLEGYADASIIECFFKDESKIDKINSAGIFSQNAIVKDNFGSTGMPYNVNTSKGNVKNIDGYWVIDTNFILMPEKDINYKISAWQKTTQYIIMLGGSESEYSTYIPSVNFTTTYEGNSNGAFRIKTNLPVATTHLEYFPVEGYL